MMQRDTVTLKEWEEKWCSHHALVTEYNIIN